MNMQWATGAAVVMLSISAFAQTSQPAWEKNELGELILRPFDHAPYPHASRDKGYQGRSKFYEKAGHYDDSTVGVFVPASFAPGEAVNYVVFFHGHVNRAASAIKQYKLLEQVAAAKVNAVLLVPQGPKDAADSGDGKLELDKNGMRDLLEEVTAFLKAEGKTNTSKIGKVVLSAHSGGYKVTAAILDHGGLSDNITDVFLLDASYGSLEWFVNWCKADKQHHLVSLFTEHLADQNAQLIQLLTKAGVAHLRLEEAAVTPATFTLREPTFIATKLAHNDVPCKTEYLRRLFEASALKRGLDVH
jgi:methylmalonyl-CoA mutase cobalamin-binding subunit